MKILSNDLKSLKYLKINIHSKQAIDILLKRKLPLVLSTYYTFKMKEEKLE